MPLIKNGEFADDNWIVVGDEDELPTDAPVIVSAARWQAERDALVGRNAPLGVKLEAGEAPELIADDLDRFQLVAVNFPAFKDGRGFSYASLLRDRYGFDGEVRAVGEVLRDQWSLMVRCGFDAFDVADGTKIEAFKEALGEFSHVYQATGDGKKTVWQLRHGG
jgi:uncharacterized protein (DUF934 family)